MESPSAWRPRFRLTTSTRSRRRSQFHTEMVIEKNPKRSLDKPPKIDVLEYMEYLKGPDFPTGAMIYGIDGIVDMYRTGQRSLPHPLRGRGQRRLERQAHHHHIHPLSSPKKSGMLQGIAELVTKEVDEGNQGHQRRIEQGRNPRRHRDQAERRPSRRPESALQIQSGCRSRTRRT